MSDKLVTISEYVNYLEADLARQMLEDNGIKVAISGENTANVFSGLPNLSRIELQVFEEDAEKAIEILKTIPEQGQQEREQDE
jgi:hypothetical protein